MQPLLEMVPAKYCNERKNDFRFYNVLCGERSPDKQVILNKFLNLCGMKWVALSGDRKGQVLKPCSFQYYIKLLFYVFKDKGIQCDWKKGFDKKGEFQGVMITYWEEVRKTDPLFGTSRNQAHFDEEANEKIRTAVKNGVLNPYKDPKDCQRVAVFMLGRHYGMRGLDEITYLRFELVGSGVFGKKFGPLHGLKFYVVRIPFDKTNKLSMLNVTLRPVQYQHMRVCEDPSDPILCPVKFFDHYFSKCHPRSSRFFGKIATPKQRMEFQRQGLGDIWYVDAQSSNTNTVIGKGTIRTMAKEVAQHAGFDNWEKCTNHGNRAYAITSMIENGALLEDRMVFARHKSANSQQPYARLTATREVNRHDALRAKPTEDSKPAAVIPAPVAKNTHGMLMGGGPAQLTTLGQSASTLIDPEWEEFQKFKAMKQMQCQSVAAPVPAPAPVPVAAAPLPSSAPSSNNNMMSMFNQMSSMSPMMNPMAMNPMASMINPMMGMGMGMMNPMAMNPMMGMMNPMSSMMANPIAMGVAMGMQMAQGGNSNNQNGNTNNGIDVTGEHPQNPNNRIL